MRAVTSFAFSGSVTVEKTMGMSLVAATAAWLVGVVIVTITSGLSPMNWRTICCPQKLDGMKEWRRNVYSLAPAVPSCLPCAGELCLFSLKRRQSRPRRSAIAASSG